LKLVALHVEAEVVDCGHLESMLKSLLWAIFGI
jgi:hypothetical protein